MWRPLWAQELLGPLRVIYDSFVETGSELVADGHVLDIIQRVAVFGMPLVPLDIHEEPKSFRCYHSPLGGWQLQCTFCECLIF